MRAPMIIWRLLALDLARLILLTTSAFVFILSIAASIKFFAEGTLSLADVLLFILYACPTMLIYAMPFAALLAATLTYHRFEQDNERLAAHAGGVSHRSLLAPAIVAGLVLAGLMWVINQEISPRFLRRMEELVFARVGKVLVTTIENGEPIVYDNWMIYADKVRRIPLKESDGDVYEKYALFGVGAIQLDDEGAIEMETTAGVAWVYLARTSDGAEGDATTVWLRLEDANTKTRENTRFSAESLEQTFSEPDRFDDNPKYLTRAESKRAYRNPDLLNIVDIRRQDLAHHEAQRRVIEHLNRSMAADGAARLVDNVGRKWTLRARGIEWSGAGYDVLPLNGAVILDRVVEDSYTRRTTGESASMKIDIGDDVRSRVLNIELVMRPASTSDLDENGEPIGQPGVREEGRWAELSLTIDPLTPLMAMNSTELLNEVARKRLRDGEVDQYVAGAYRKLQSVIDDQKREIVSKQHERTATAVSCLVMVLSGSVIALRLGRKLPLTAYLTSFFPAIMSLVVISAGQQVGHNAGLTGILLLWSGVGGLALFVLIAYVGLVRH